MSRIATAAVLCCLLVLHAAAQPSGEERRPEHLSGRAWHHVTVGVADLDAALATWVGMMGFEVRVRREGPDEGLGRLWQIHPDDVERQAMLGTPGARNGLIHLVQFRDPSPPVRQGAEVFDMLPKNLDVFVRDLPRRFEELRAGGADFRTDTYSEVTTPSGAVFREIHMHGHDVTNIDLAALKDRLRAYGWTYEEYSPVDTLFGFGPAISFHSPAGLRIEVHQRQ